MHGLTLQRSWKVGFRHLVPRRANHAITTFIRRILFNIEIRASLVVTIYIIISV